MFNPIEVYGVINGVKNIAGVYRNHCISLGDDRRLCPHSVHIDIPIIVPPKEDNVLINIPCV